MNDPVDLERFRRFRISVWAYAREFHGHKINTDALYLHLCKGIDLNIRTFQEKLDLFFICEFQVGATSWVRRHPNLNEVAANWHAWHKGGKNYD